jgi:hypothetical protein
MPKEQFEKTVQVKPSTEELRRLHLEINKCNRKVVDIFREFVKDPEAELPEFITSKWKANEMTGVMYDAAFECLHLIPGHVSQYTKVADLVGS